MKVSARIRRGRRSQKLSQRKMAILKDMHMKLYDLKNDSDRIFRGLNRHPFGYQKVHDKNIERCAELVHLFAKFSGIRYRESI